MSDRDMSGYYTYVENKDKTWTGIGLTDKAGKWQGVVYEYGKVSIKEDEENDTAFVENQFVFVSDDFFNLIGDILHSLIEQNLDKSGLLTDADDDDRKNNI